MIYSLRLLVSVAIFAAWAAFAAPASAQTGLPTAPAADRAGQGGYTSAPASLPGYGASPLEPYLITWLLPISGLLCAIIGIGVDRRMRGSVRRA
jgi:hypothetical protein